MVSQNSLINLNISGFNVVADWCPVQYVPNQPVDGIFIM